VLSTNEAARALYRSIGFAVEGVPREDCLIDGEYVDDVLMAIPVA
jgi:RimJ/RimL family protein N-acetyltransferase